MRRQAGWIVALSMAVSGAGPARAQVPAAATPPGVQTAADTEASCRACHPGAVQALQHTVHRDLLVRADTCATCHGDLARHAEAQSRPGEGQAVAVAAVAAAACVQCHPGRTLDPAPGAHGSQQALPDPAAALSPERARDLEQLLDLGADSQRTAILWSGLLDFGYRFVHVAGSRPAYETDVDLEPGPRLRAAELRGRGSSNSAFDELFLHANDIGDPRWGVGGEVKKQDTGRVDVDFRRDRFRYEASGDWHHVDRSARTGTGDVDVELGGGVRAFASLQHFDEEGFWLTERVGNRNVSVQSFVTGVASPRQAKSDDTEVGVTGGGADWTWTLAGSWREDHTVDRWSYSRPAPANPAFPESEDFTSRTSLRGPGARGALHGDLAPLSLDMNVRWFDHDRRVVGTGTSAGFDVAQFTTDTDAIADGSARTWLADLAMTLELADDLRFVVDLHWRDHTEDLLLQQSDVTTFPSLSTTIAVFTLADQHTAQRLFDGAATLEWTACEGLDLGVGYGFAREQLRVPDVDPTDPGNFRRGTTRDDGVLANARWQPAAHWTVRGDLRAFGQDGVLLYELAPEETREESGSVAWADERSHTTVFVRHRRNENDVSQHRLDSLATGITTGVTRTGLGADVAYTFARVDTQTLTNFYFDPDPNPVPTLVGFAGDTNTISGSLHLQPSGDVQWNVIGSYATTVGDFDVATLDWRLDLRWLVAGPHGYAGTEYRQSFYKATGGVDDWSAQSVFVYWRQLF